MQDLDIPHDQINVNGCAIAMGHSLGAIFSMILGTLPLALASGAGAESRHQIGWVIVGGLLLGTLFSVYIVPVAYSFIARDRARRPNLDYEAIEAGAGQPGAAE